MKAKHNLEHIVFNSWKRKADRYKDQKIVVAVSGGCDSMVLLHCLLACFSKERLVVVHCHHGQFQNLKYRNKAQKLVEDFCRKKGLLFVVFMNETKMASEAEFREFRLSSFLSVGQQFSTQLVCLAHHQDDWLENQLIKLIRGSSFAALKQTFQWSKLKEPNLILWRPFSQIRRVEIEAYQAQNKVQFAEDPSNNENHYLRNWIRNIWLQLLEETRPGSTHRLAHSLIHSIAEMKPKTQTFPWNFKTNSIDFVYFLSLSESERLRCLAFYVRSKGIGSVHANQLKEILRQLDKNSDRYHIAFKTFSCSVNAGQLQFNFKVVK